LQSITRLVPQNIIVKILWLQIYYFLPNI